MLSPEPIAEYRRLTPGQRLEFSFAMIRENNVDRLLQGRPLAPQADPPDVDRLLRKQIFPM
jgi:hypothetical protein